MHLESGIVGLFEIKWKQCESRLAHVSDWNVQRICMYAKKTVIVD